MAFTKLPLEEIDFGGIFGLLYALRMHSDKMAINRSRTASMPVVSGSLNVTVPL